MVNVADKTDREAMKKDSWNSPSKPPAKAVAEIVPAEQLETWLTRTEAAELMHVSEKAILNWVDDGLLHPQSRAQSIEVRDGRRSVNVYNPRELLEIGSKRVRKSAPPSTPGAIAAVAYECFDDGLTMRDVVRRTHRPLKEVEALHEQWLEAGGADIVITGQAKAMLEACVGSFDNVTELCERVESMSKEFDTQLELRLATAAMTATGSTIVVDVPEGSVLAVAKDEDVEQAISAALDAATAKGDAAP